jgi:hypothetical protein
LRWPGYQFLPELLANPHVVPSPADGALLAVAKNRLDLVDENQISTADALIGGTDLKPEHSDHRFGPVIALTREQLPELADLADRCREALRRLGPGAARDRLCRTAAMQWGQPSDSVAAVIDARHVPEAEPYRALLLFLHEQWEDYDADDPDGNLLYEAWRDLVEVRQCLFQGHWISEQARRRGRADPKDRWEKELKARGQRPRTGPAPLNPTVPYSGFSGGAGMGPGAGGG